MKTFIRVLIGICLGTPTLVKAQSFPGPVGDASTTAVFKDDPRVDYWLEDSVQINRGYVDISNTSQGFVTYGDVEFALGESDPNVISLGDGGSAIYVLSNPISDHEGYDFAVFENAFDDFFLELAFVEVSTDGVNYVRFPNQSNTDTDTQTGTFAATYTEYVHNLAGKYRAQYGTPFDLSELEDSLDVDISNINYIRIIDVVGSVQAAYASYDSYGNIINDPWPTPFNSSGFDLDAVAVLKHVELNVSELTNNINYVDNRLTVNGDYKGLNLQIYNTQGKLIKSQNIQQNVDLNVLPKGLYILKLTDGNQMFNMKISVD